MLRLDLRDYSDACIVVKGRISVASTGNVRKRNTKLILKNNNPFRWCVSNKILILLCGCINW